MKEQFSFTVKAEPIQTMIVNGVQRKLAALTPSMDMKMGSRRFADTHPTLQAGQWQERDLSFLGSPVRDQGQHGSCTNHAGITAFDIACRQVGWVPPLLSATFLYAQVNGGQDNGASVTSILAAMQKLGNCLFSECGTDQIYKNQIPASAYETAKNYMAEPTGPNGAFLVRSFEEICSAITLGFPVAFGIRIGQNFNQLNQDGICPPPNMVIGGHALCAVGLKRYRNSWIVKFQNSWTAQWGMNGFAYLTQASFDHTIDAYAIVVPRESAADTDQPPPIKERTTFVMGSSDPKTIDKDPGPAAISIPFATLPGKPIVMVDKTIHVKREPFNAEFFTYDVEERHPIVSVGPFHMTEAERAHLKKLKKSAK